MSGRADLIYSRVAPHTRPEEAHKAAPPRHLASTSHAPNNTEPALTSLRSLLQTVPVLLAPSLLRLLQGRVHRQRDKSAIRLASGPGSGITAARFLFFDYRKRGGRHDSGAAEVKGWQLFVAVKAPRDP